MRKKKPLSRRDTKGKAASSRTASTNQKATALPRAKPTHSGCLLAPASPDTLPMRERIAVGFGDARLTRDGETVWRETYNLPWEKCLTVRRAENMAVKQADADWRIVLHGPMNGNTYQRQGAKNWVCIESNRGFA